MSTIGTFTKNGNEFRGSLQTLTINVALRISPAEKKSEAAPDYRLYAGRAEIGAGWTKTAQDTGMEYVSVKLDDPSFPAAIFANLIEDGDTGAYNLIWSRPARA